MMDVKKIFNWKNASLLGKIALVVVTPAAITAGYYIVDRKFVKKLPLLPFNLEKARAKKMQEDQLAMIEKLKNIVQPIK